MPASDQRTGWSPATLQLLRWGPAGLILVALLVATVALALGGGAAPLAIGDPGPVVRWGLPILRLSFDLSAALAVGALCIAIFACSREKPEFERAMTLAQGGSESLRSQLQQLVARALRRRLAHVNRRQLARRVNR